MKINDRWLTRQLAFLLPVLVMLILFVISRVYPFGGRCFLPADLYHQYMPFFSEMLHKLRAGESLSFSFHAGIGSNFLALFVYYLASPLNALSLLVPESLLIEFISCMVVLKIGLSGLTCCIYLQEHYKTDDLGSMIFALFYALSGFMAAYNYNIMWLDCVVLLPLIILGLERLVKEGRCGLYCVTLALSIYTNYYISIMICIFLVLYFAVLLVTEKKRLRSIGYFALFSLLAGGMAGVLLVPEVCAIIKTDFGDMDFPTTARSYFSVLDMLARHFMCVATERGLDHWPNIYCGSAALMLLPMYVINSRISIRERFCRLALAGFLLLSFGTNFLNFIWHGMNYPDSLPARQSFLYIFLVLGMCYDVYRHIKEAEPRHILYGYLAAVGFYLFCEKFVDHEDFYFGVKILTLAMISIYAILLYLYRTRTRENTHLLLGILAVVVAVAELGINTYVTGIYTTSRSAYLGQQQDYMALYERTKEREDSFYRLEKFSRKTKNDGILTGYPNASLFSSTMNSDVMDLYTRLGMRHSKVYYCFDGATALTSALLNVNYMFGDSELYENSLYTLLSCRGDVYLYQCNSILPFGYVAPKGFDLPEEEAENGLLLQSDMVKQLGIAGQLFLQETALYQKDNVEFHAMEPGIYYAVLTSSGTSKVDYIGGSTEMESFADLKVGSVLYLGRLEKDQTITLTNGDEEDNTRRIDAKIYRMNEDVLREAISALSAQHLENVSWESDRISGELTLQQEGRLILSVPYEAGWTVRINGKEAARTTFGGCLMAFDLEPGRYTLEMHYVPEGQWQGLAVSAGSLTVFAAVMIFTWLRRRQKKREKQPDSALSEGEYEQKGQQNVANEAEMR